MTKLRIREFARELGRENVYISFSGGIDSTVLLDIARKIYSNIPAAFMDTGFEYPEIRQFVKTFENVEIINPGKYNRQTKKYDPLSFKDVIIQYGYPLISKEVSQVIRKARAGQEHALCKLNGTLKDKNGNKSRYCCEKYLPLLDAPFKISDMCCTKVKKEPGHRYTKRTGRYPITAEMACESMFRTQQWLTHGCNGFDMKLPKSTPMSFWTTQDVLQYVKQNNLPIASVYGDICYSREPEQMRLEDYGCYESDYISPERLCTTGCERTGCIYCAFGAHLEKVEGRFERLKRTHPKQYQYCIGGGEYNNNGLWQPNTKGLGMGFVFGYLNNVYGKGFIRH